MRRRRFTGLWRHSDFLKLWTGQTVSVFGSLVGAPAMAFTAILVLHATPLQLGLLSASRLIPGLLSGLIAGAWADRNQRRPILIFADVGRAALLATIPIAALLHALRMEQLYLVTFAVSILSVFFDTAYQSYLPSLIERGDLIEGNSKLAASASIAEVGGFGLAGWLVQIFTAPITIGIDAASFVVSAISLRLIKAAEPVSDCHTEPLDLWREIGEGLRAVWDDGLLRAMTACSLFADFFLGIFGTLVVLYMVRELGFAPGVLGAIWAVGGLSSLAGAAGTEPITRTLGIGKAMILGMILSSSALFLIPIAHGATFAAATLLIFQQVLGDGGATVSRINQVSLRQAITSPRLLGRVNASTDFVRLGATLVGSLTGGVLGENIGVRPTLILACSGALVSTIWLILSPLRVLRVAPQTTA